MQQTSPSSGSASLSPHYEGAATLQQTQENNNQLKQNVLNKVKQRILKDFYSEQTQEKSPADESSMIGLPLLIESYQQSNKSLSSLNTQLDALKADHDTQQHRINALETKLLSTKEWLETNFPSQQQEQQQQPDVFFEQLVKPKDQKRRLLMELGAEDMAYDDIFYQLDKALNKGVIDIHSFLKFIRTYSREQFFKRALFNKITKEMK